MSARQPFMPTGRTAVPSSDNLTAPPSAQPPKDTSQQLQLHKMQTEFGNKPFNVSGLIPKNKAVLALRHAKMTEGRPHSPASSYQQSLQIASPKPSAPFYANGGTNTTGIITVTTFGENATGLASTDQTISRDTTSLMRRGSLVSPPPSSSLSYPNLANLKHHASRIHHSNSLDKIKEMVDEDDDQGSLVEEHEHEEGHGFSQNSPYRRERFQQRFPSPEAQEDGSRMLRRTSKKRQPMSDDEDEYGYSAPAKRFKSDDQEQVCL